MALAEAEALLNSSKITPPFNTTFPGSNTDTGADADPVVDPMNTSLQDLYPDLPTASAPTPSTVQTPTGAQTQDTDKSLSNVGTPGVAEAATEGLADSTGNINAEQTAVSDDQLVDKELERILGKDSPLLARARADAARLANSRGLQNTSIAAGMAQGALVDRAMPMAQQNASQAFQRETSNTALRQEASMFNESERNRLAALEAELGTQVSVFNAEQLNQAERLAAQMRVAQDQQDADAYNRASLQLAELQRSAQAQQADINFAAEQQKADAQNRMVEQRMSAITALNEQYLRGSQAMDLATIQGTYQQIIATNQTAGQLYQSYFNGISSVMDNPEMTPTQIATAVAGMQQMLEASLRMIAKMNDMDFGNIGATIPGGSQTDSNTLPGQPGGPSSPPPSIPGGTPGGGGGAYIPGAYDRK